MGRSVLSATGFPYCCFVQARAQEIERLQQDQEKQENGRAYQSMLHRKAAQLYEGDGGEREETCSREGCTRVAPSSTKGGRGVGEVWHRYLRPRRQELMWTAMHHKPLLL